MIDDHNDHYEVREEALQMRLVLKIRALRATAASSEHEAEARSFQAKAAVLADRHGIPAALLDYPGESLRVALLMAELHRVKAAIATYEVSTDLWATKTTEWSDLLDELDSLLEVAADELNLPIPVLPYGSRRHFRPQERAEIEDLLDHRVATTTASAERLRAATMPDSVPRSA